MEPREPAGKPEKITNRLFGWARRAVSSLEAAMEEVQAAAPAPAVVEPSDNAAAPGPRSGPSTGPMPPAPAARSGTDQFTPSSPVARRAAETGSLARSLAAGLPAEADGEAEAAALEPGSPEALEEASRLRMQAIVAYIKAPDHPDFQDRTTVYSLVSTERSYQQTKVLECTSALKRLGPDPGPAGPTDEAARAKAARRQALAEEIDRSKKRQAQLFTLLKGLTGVKGKTGGTGFIARAEPDPPPWP